MCKQAVLKANLFQPNQTHLLRSGTAWCHFTRQTTASSQPIRGLLRPTRAIYLQQTRRVTKSEDELGAWANTPTSRWAQIKSAGLRSSRMSSDDFRSSSHLSLAVGGFTAPIHTCIHRILVQQRRVRLGQHMSVNGGYDDRLHTQLGPGNRICMGIFSWLLFTLCWSL